MGKGRRPLPWIKLWFDIIGDPKTAQLSAGEKWCWVGILLLAGQSPVRGRLMLSENKPMDEKDIYRALRLSQKERSLLKNCIMKMQDMRSLVWNDNCLTVVHFRDRQEAYPSDLINYHKKPPLITAELTPDSLLKTPELTPDLLQKEGEGRGETKKKKIDITPKANALGARKKRTDPLADPRVKEIIDEVKKFFGYPEKTDKDPIPNYGMEGQAIKRMLTRRFTCDEILACWRSKVSRRGGEFVSMKWVNQDIGDFARGGEALPASPRGGQNQAMTAESGSTSKGGNDGRAERGTDAHQRGDEKLGQWKVTESGGEKGAGD